jgi:dTDP-4-amino-4,6-dideoxygalactose transaminase
LITDSIVQNQYTNFGINHNRLKEKFSELTGIKNIVLTANATVALDGLHNILANKCGLALLPSFTSPATNQGCQVSVIMSRTISGGDDIGRPQWDDVDGDTYAITVNPFGSITLPCSRPKTKYWIVDNAAGFIGQTQRWVDAGADAVIYSLSATKILSACEGGVVFFNNKDLYEEYSEYINSGCSLQPDGHQTIGVKGSNHKMSELNAAWCLMSMQSVSADINERTKLLVKYKEFCENNKIPYIPSLQSFWLIGQKKATEIQKFASERNIDIRPNYQTLPITGKCMITKLFNENGFCLPTRPTLEDNEIEQIMNMLHEAKASFLL